MCQGNLESAFRKHAPFVFTNIDQIRLIIWQLVALIRGWPNVPFTEQRAHQVYIILLSSIYLLTLAKSSIRHYYKLFFFFLIYTHLITFHLHLHTEHFQAHTKHIPHIYIFRYYFAQFFFFVVIIIPFYSCKCACNLKMKQH